MQEEPQSNPLMKQVPGHLFKFEEKIFGMSLPQLLADLGIMTGSFSLTGSLHPTTRIVVCMLIIGCALVCIHGKMQGVSFGYWLSLLIRSRIVPTRTIWQPVKAMNDHLGQKGTKRLPSVQATWIPIQTLQQGIAGKSERRNKVEMTRYWMVFEVEGKNIRLFPEHEQVRVFRRLNHFSPALSFICNSSRRQRRLIRRPLHRF